MASSSHETFISAPRSDGDEELWPTVTTPQKSHDDWNWYKHLDSTSQKSKLWRRKVAQYVASEMNNRARKPPLYDLAAFQYILKELPAGYQLFEHQKMVPGQGVRYDTYLFGGAARYRSPAEFQPHFLWLFLNQSQDPSTCECRYCTGQGRTPVKRQATTQRTQRNPRIRPAEMARDQAPDAPSLRRGELVWIKMEYDEAGETADSLHLWPAVIVNMKAVGGSARQNNASRDPWAYWAKLLKLGTERSVPVEQLQPWLSHDPFPLPTMELDGPSSTVAFDIKRPSTLLSNWIEAVEEGNYLAQTYSPFDRFTHTESADRLAGVTDLVQRQRLELITKCPHYHGIFFGPDKLWTGEVMRLTRDIEGDEDPPNDFTEFLYIDSIWKNLETKRVVFSGHMYAALPSNRPINSEQLSDAPFSLTDMPMPPSGCAWHALNRRGQEVEVSLTQVAGRYHSSYPDVQNETFIRYYKRTRIEALKMLTGHGNPSFIPRGDDGAGQDYTSSYEGGRKIPKRRAGSPVMVSGKENKKKRVRSEMIMKEEPVVKRRSTQPATKREDTKTAVDQATKMAVDRGRSRSGSRTPFVDRREKSSEKIRSKSQEKGQQNVPKKIPSKSSEKSMPNLLDKIFSMPLEKKRSRSPEKGQPNLRERHRSESSEVLDTIIVEEEKIVRTPQHPTCPLLNVVVIPSQDKHIVNIAGCSSIEDVRAEVLDDLACHAASGARYFAMTLGRQYKQLEEVNIADIMTIVVVCK